MMIPRLIPCLLLKNKGLYKTVKFKNPVYVGDPMNAIKIFNEKEVDELIFLDIDATREKKEPQLELLYKIASECFMPLCYGGGVKTIEHIHSITKVGVEKVAINSEAYSNPNFIKKAAEVFGSSTIVISIDYKKNIFGKNQVYIHSGTENTGKDPLEYALKMQELGAGEIMLNCIDRDGMMNGMDTEMIFRLSSQLSIPVIACGGVGNYEHISDAVKKGNASAVAAGSFFVFHGKHKAVLISYPTFQKISEIFS